MRKVLYAKLHEAAYLPNAGDMTQTLPPTNKVWPDLDMRWSPEGILIYTHGRVALVPWANVKIAEISPEEGEVKAPPVTPKGKAA